MQQTTPLVSIRGLTKIFGGQRALDGVDLTIMPREIHGLLGENGSGKSTLIKVLVGVPQARQRHAGGARRGRTAAAVPGQYRQLGFDFVHQDLGLLPSLSVTENLYLDEIAQSEALMFSWRAARATRRRAPSRSTASTSTRRRVWRRLAPSSAPCWRSSARSSRCAAARPTTATCSSSTSRRSSCRKQEAGLLFYLMRRVTRDGSSVLFVSHDLDEVREITDRVTVLRDGRRAGPSNTAEASGRDLIKMIVGHDLADCAADVEAGRPAGRSCVGARAAQRLPDAARFDLREGEILGFAGLIGSGYEDVVYSCSAARARRDGTVTRRRPTRRRRRRQPAAGDAPGHGPGARRPRSATAASPTCPCRRTST